MIRRALNRLVRWAQRYGEAELTCSPVPSLPKNTLNNTRPNLNMCFYVGIGGKIVEFVWHDERTDDRKSKFYVIPDDQDMNEELTRIISMEMMRY